MKKIFKVCYVEYFENLNTGEESKIRKIGDVIGGNLYIEFLNIKGKTENELSYKQEKGFEGIEAVVEIIEQINSDTYYAKSSISNKNIILTDFLGNFSGLQKGDRISMSGCLNIELKEYIDELDLRYKDEVV